MAYKKVKLLNQAGDELYPRTTIDNILEAAGSTVYANLVKLNGMGKIDATYLPSYVDDVVELIAMSSTAPATCAKDDMYFNSTDSLIYTATAADTWSTTGEAPEKGVIYMDLSTSDPTKNPNIKIYRWSGSQMIEIYEQYATVTAVGPASGDGAATDTEVPTALAVRKAISSAHYTLPEAGSAGTATELGGVYVGSNIAVNAGGTISVATAGVGAAGVVALTSSNAVTSASTDETTAVTPKAVATVLGSYQKAFTTSNNVSINNGTISVATGGIGTAGVVALASATSAASVANNSTTAVTPAGLSAALGGYQTKITTTSNVTLSGNTLSVAVAAGSAVGLVAVDQATTSGVKLVLDGGTVSAQGVAATTGAAGVMRFATAAETSGGSSVDAAVKPGDLATVLGGYQAAFTTTTNITVNGTSIAVATAGYGSNSKGVLGIDSSVSNGTQLTIADGVLAVSATIATVSSAGPMKLASSTSVVGPSEGVAATFTGSNTAVTPEVLGNALIHGVFYAEIPAPT